MLERQVLRRISRALEAACAALRQLTRGGVAVAYNYDDDPVTAADKLADKILREYLASEGEGWLSEHTPYDASRLKQQRVWIVDPLDGTREFVAGIPESCVSIAFVEDGVARAGGVCNPATGELFLGAPGNGVRYNRTPASCSARDDLTGATVLASRSDRFDRI